MKRRLAGTTLGQALLRLRQDLAFRTMALSNPEQAGILANQIIADRLIARLCPRGGTFLDIGAHYGTTFGAACHHDPTLTVIAFEADPAKAAALSAAFPRHRIHDLAVGEAEGRATFFRDPEASGYNSLVPDASAGKDRIEVQVVALDEVLPDVTVDVVKIDIEGAELGALRGGRKLLERSRPVIMFECVLPEPNALGYSAVLLWDWFDAMGFRIFTPDRLAHEAPGLNREVFADAQLYPFRSHNYFAVHEARVTETRERARAILGVAVPSPPPARPI
ncbi:MAG: FkbM family methyltransferase [Rubellimicrobium sp.]|nr:FkbM family methyltransferase [Rubellimicrobium sp.]